MQNFLIRHFVPRGDASDPAVRRAYGQLAGGVGIALNALLCAAKMAAGLLSGSISVLSDAVNNLSDMGSSLISIISARLSGRQPDPEHPFGHGRVEYISSLIIAFLILFAGGQLLISSIQKLIAPEEVTAGWPLLCVMVLSALVKLWMWAFNRGIGKRISSSVQLATARDSLNDCLITLTVAAATVIAVSTGEMRVDGGAGALVALLVLKSGFDVAHETIDQLLGGRPDPELVRKLADEVRNTDMVVGVHDLIVHDYGPGRVMASVHAEVPDNADIVRAHEAIDEAERRIYADLRVPIVIHLDPVKVGSERVDAVRAQVVEAVQAENPRFSIHDFRMTDGQNRINLIFDIAVPVGMKQDERAQALSHIEARLRAKDARYRMVAHVDENYQEA